jgi:hypothetical protein
VEAERKVANARGQGESEKLKELMSHQWRVGREGRVDLIAEMVREERMDDELKAGGEKATHNSPS